MASGRIPRIPAQTLAENGFTRTDLYQGIDFSRAERTFSPRS